MARRLGDERTLARVLSRAKFIDVTARRARSRDRAATPRCWSWRAGSATASWRCARTRSSCATTSQLGDIAAVDRELEAYERLARGAAPAPAPLARPAAARDAGDDRRPLRGGRAPRAGGPRAGASAAGEPVALQFFSIQASLIYRLQGRLERDRRRRRRSSPTASPRSPPGGGR